MWLHFKSVKDLLGEKKKFSDLNKDTIFKDWTEGLLNKFT